MRPNAYACSLLIIGLATGSGAQACSVPGSYRVPTTLHLVEQADAIVLARVVDGGPIGYPPAARLGIRSARLVPFAAIKGEYAGHQIIFDDAAIEDVPAGLKVAPSDPRNLVDANADAFSGFCNRVAFRQGMIIVAFLKKDKGNLVSFAPAFSRALEDVPSPDALWVKAVRLYVKIADVPKSRRMKEMRYRRDLLNLEIDDPDSRLLALELDRAIREP